jgi:hypothetical protein
MRGRNCQLADNFQTNDDPVQIQRGFPPANANQAILEPNPGQKLAKNSNEMHLHIVSRSIVNVENRVKMLVELAAELLGTVYSTAKVCPSEHF